MKTFRRNWAPKRWKNWGCTILKYHGVEAFFLGGLSDDVTCLFHPLEVRGKDATGELWSSGDSEGSVFFVSRYMMYVYI